LTAVPGLSAADFAQYMGTARETVSRWETGKQPMGQSADRLLRLLVVTKAPEQDYALVDVLKEITEEPAPKRLPRFGMRVSSNGWRRRELAAVAD
jgi:transcriptional regulator with XRE-family HTH domain